MHGPRYRGLLVVGQLRIRQRVRKLRFGVCVRFGKLGLGLGLLVLG